MPDNDIRYQIISKIKITTEMNCKIHSNKNKVDCKNRSSFEGARMGNLIEKWQISGAVASGRMYWKFILFIPLL